MTAQWLERQTENRNLAEARVLGTMLARPDLSPVALALIGPDDFRHPAHRTLAQVIWSLDAERKPLNLDSIVDRLIGQNVADEVGGVGAVYQLLQHEESDLRAVDEMRDLARRRHIYTVCQDGTLAITNPDRTPDDVAADLYGQLRSTSKTDPVAPISTVQLLAMDEPDWLIDGMFPQGLNVLFGSPKSGKSYLALSMAWSLALGHPWFRKNTNREPVQVLYLAGEGIGDLRLRADAMYQHTRAQPSDMLRWWPASLSLSKDTDAARLRLEVERCDAKVIFVDTWARYAGVRDENDAAETQRAVAALEHLTLEGRSVVVVHHTSKAGTMRGSSALAGAVEAAARVQVSEDTTHIRLTSELARRGAGFPEMLLEWRRVGPDSILTERTWPA